MGFIVGSCIDSISNICSADASARYAFAIVILVHCRACQRCFRSFEFSFSLFILCEYSPWAGTAPDGSPCKIMTPVRGDALNEKFFVAQKWEDWDKESWQELVGRSAAVLLSDGMQ